MNNPIDQITDKLTNVLDPESLGLQLTDEVRKAINEVRTDLKELALLVNAEMYDYD